MITWGDSCATPESLGDLPRQRPLGTHVHSTPLHERIVPQEAVDLVQGRDAHGSRAVFVENPDIGLQQLLWVPFGQNLAHLSSASARLAVVVFRRHETLTTFRTLASGTCPRRPPCQVARKVARTAEALDMADVML